MPDPPANTTNPGSWRLAHGRTLTLDRARILAILNITPDSFSDGGRLPTIEAALDAARQAIERGADMLDIGGESTRPGAETVDDAQQIDRVAPVIAAIRGAGIDCPISVDTTRAAVAIAALDAGADAVNDVSAGTDDEGMLPLIAARGAGVILMHRLRPACDDSWSDRYAKAPAYPDGVVTGVRRFLQARAQAAIDAGIDPGAIAIDPGLGFGKSVEQNFELIAATGALVALGFPVVGAASRKSFLGAVTGVTDPAERVAESVAASVTQRLQGAGLFRVHDVSAQARGLRIADRILGKSLGSSNGNPR